jgi:hypothetical protein
MSRACLLQHNAFGTGEERVPTQTMSNDIAKNARMAAIQMVFFLQNRNRRSLSGAQELAVDLSQCVSDLFASLFVRSERSFLLDDRAAMVDREAMSARGRLPWVTLSRTRPKEDETHVDETTKIGLAAATAIAIAGMTVTLPGQPMQDGAAGTAVAGVGLGPGRRRPRSATGLATPRRLPTTAAIMATAIPRTATRLSLAIAAYYRYGGYAPYYRYYRRPYYRYAY